MQVIYGIGKVKKAFNNAVLAIGIFDGVHVGHQELIQRAVQKAKQRKGEAVVMTFYPHPVHVLHPDKYLPYIISLSHRLKLIESLGAAACVVIHFTKRFATLSPESFVKRYLGERIKPKEVIVGDDFRFGKDRGGSLDVFKRYGDEHGFTVSSIKPVGGEKQGYKNIGSSVIRHLIDDGKLLQAERLLKRPVSILGKVIKGDGRGKGLGFPTANIIPTGVIVPPLGAYAVKVHVGKKQYYGMANIGRRPSFKSSNTPVNVESHIFNFNKNIYNQEILVEFIKRIRKEKSFTTKDQLITQLKKDEIKARQFLKKIFPTPYSDNS